MSQILVTQGRIAGSLLLPSMLPLTASTIHTIRDVSQTIYGLLRPIEDLAERLPLSSWELVRQVANLVLVIAGYGVLATVLQEAGDRALPLHAFALLLGSAILAAFEGTFYQSVSHWAAKKVVRTGSSPELFQAMHRWFNTSVKAVYMMLGLLAIAGFNWSLLRTGLLPEWAGWATILWSFVWFIFTVVAQFRTPAGVFLCPGFSGRS